MRTDAHTISFWLYVQTPTRVLSPLRTQLDAATAARGSFAARLVRTAAAPQAAAPAAAAPQQAGVGVGERGVMRSSVEEALISGGHLPFLEQFIASMERVTKNTKLLTPITGTLRMLVLEEHERAGLDSAKVRGTAPQPRTWLCQRMLRHPRRRLTHACLLLHTTARRSGPSRTMGISSALTRTTKVRRPMAVY